VLGYRSSNASLSSAGAPKLAAERDKDGHIEYKLKLIDPTPERFERLVTQMMWRLKQGRNEAIYEIGLAGESSVTRCSHRPSARLLESPLADLLRRRNCHWPHSA
jgi:GTPase